MSVRKVVELASVQSGDLVGRIASDFYQIEDPTGQWTYACDVDIGQDTGIDDEDDDGILKNVPVAYNNKDILYADVGKPVALKRVGTGGYEIIGLAKHCIGATHIQYVDLTDQFGAVVSEETKGIVVRMLRYEELSIYASYGVLPYGVFGRFNLDGTLQKILM